MAVVFQNQRFPGVHHGGEVLSLEVDFSSTLDGARDREDAGELGLMVV